MRKQYYFRKSPNGYAAWDVDRLIELAVRLSVHDVPLREIREIDEPFRLEGTDDVLTCREVAEHVRLTNEADLAYPIILATDDRVVDGMHRVLKTVNEGAIQSGPCRSRPTPSPTTST